MEQIPLIKKPIIDKQNSQLRPCLRESNGSLRGFRFREMKKKLTFSLSQPIKIPIKRTYKISQYKCHLTSTNIIPSIQKLMKGFKAAVVRKDYVEYGDKSKLKARLPLLDNRNSNSDETNRIHDLKKREVHLNQKHTN